MSGTQYQFLKLMLFYDTAIIRIPEDNEFNAMELTNEETSKICKDCKDGCCKTGNKSETCYYYIDNKCSIHDIRPFYCMNWFCEKLVDTLRNSLESKGIKYSIIDTTDNSDLSNRDTQNTMEVRK